VSDRVSENGSMLHFDKQQAIFEDKSLQTINCTNNQPNYQKPTENTKTQNPHNTNKLADTAHTCGYNCATQYSSEQI